MSADASQHEPLRPAEVIGLGRLSMTSDRDGDVHTIALSGELDLANASDVERALDVAEATDAASIVLDLSGLTFIDSTGIRLIVSADARSRANSHRLTLLRGSPAVERVFVISGIDKIVTFAD
ncbi:MAG TPA: STAS domain-containing protein [Solirubrobacteraceae bacterium]|jgi:anti-anti-sigma factor|nr:STAS domain-containing protein [Solirubrobacteraceae bacterium]